MIQHENRIGIVKLPPHPCIINHQAATNYVNALNLTAYKLSGVPYQSSGGAYRNASGHAPQIYKDYVWNESSALSKSEYTRHDVIQLDTIVNTIKAKSAIAPTPTPTPKPTPTPTPTPIATSSGASLTQSQLTAIEGLQVKNGFTILTHFKESSTDKDGDKSHEATMSKNGYTYDYTLDACHDTAKADSTFTTRIAAAKVMGATGDYDDAYTWLGVLAYNGQPVGVGVQEMRDSNPPVVISYVLA